MAFRIQVYRVNSNIYLALRRGYRFIELTPIFILHGIEDTGIYRVNSNIYLAWHRGYRFIVLTPVFFLLGIA